MSVSIQILPPEEAKKIAAGEVIDRPAALVREFMDNSIDANASLIEVSIDGGGVTRTEVSDDGSGMGREDLELCCHTHATSKIRSVRDLDYAETLGFRGEALAAAASVSRVEILTSADGQQAWKLVTGSGLETCVEQSRRTKGTSVRSIGLFDSIPARKRFLKREGSEAAACRMVFNDKALAFPARSFRFFQDGKLKTFLPPDSSLKERFGKIVLDSGERAFLHEITAKGRGFEVIIVFGGPELSRSDRRQQYVFTNGRRIQDYSLLQALEYGLRGSFPNGSHPVGAVFVNIDPALADFNIHPAKREVRFADAGSIHHSVTGAIENYMRGSVRAAAGGFVPELAASALFADEPEPSFIAKNEELNISSINNSPVQRIPVQTHPGGIMPGNDSNRKPRLLGRLFELFILVEQGDRFFIIDQHAAHERILYNKFITGTIPQQELLVSIPFITENEEDDNFLINRRKELASLGILIRKEGGEWRIDALPADWRLSDTETVKEILNLKTAGKNLAEHWAATLSCKKAVKDGDYLDETSALALAEEALRLTDPHCPHGRPVWVEITREELLKAVKRI